MKQQTTAVLLCALLFSTFAHEHLRAHHPPPGIHSARNGRSHSRSALQDRTLDEEVCYVSCNITGGNGLTFIFNETSGIIAVVNETAKVAWVLDINLNITALFNGTSGAVIVVNLTTSSGAYLSGSSSLLVWLASRQTFAAYINGLSSLKSLLEYAEKNGVSFNKSTITNIILEAIGEILVHLSAEWAIELKDSYSQAFTLLLNISIKISTLFKGPLNGILKVFTQTVVVIRGDFLWLVSVFEGLGTLFGQIKGGIFILIEKSIKLNLETILTAESGLDIFVYIFITLSAHLDVSVVLGGVLNSIDGFLILIVQLSGNVNQGISGLVKVISQLVAVINGKVSISVFIDVLIQYSISGSSGGSLSVEWSSFVTTLLTLTSRFNSTTSIRAFVIFVENLRDQKLIINGVNVSQIILILLKNGSILPVDLVVRILFLLKIVVEPALAFPRLFYNLIILLNTTIGVHILIAFFPGTNITKEIQKAGSTKIIDLIFEGINIENILRGGVVGSISRIPIIGAIFTTISASLSVVSNGSLTLTIAFQSPKADATIKLIIDFLESCARLVSFGPGPVILPPVTRHPTHLTSIQWARRHDREHHESNQIHQQDRHHLTEDKHHGHPDSRNHHHFGEKRHQHVDEKHHLYEKL